MSLERNLQSFWVWTCSFCFWQSFCRRGKRFSAICLMFKSWVKMRRQSYNVANVFNTTRFLLVGDLEHFLPIFQYELVVGDLTVSKFQKKSLHFWNRLPLKRLCSTHDMIKKGVFKHFVSHRSWGFKVKAKLYEKFPFLEFCYLWAKTIAERTHHSAHSKVNCTETQNSLSVTCTTIIHRRLSQRCLAAHSFITSG